jgi:hypothetical protein
VKNLDALCCDSCRAKVAEIEARDELAATDVDQYYDDFTARAVMDRRVLLGMLEQLLGTVARQREAVNVAKDLVMRMAEDTVKEARALLASRPDEAQP